MAIIPIELYDFGRTTHKSLPDMYNFIMQNADRLVSNAGLAAKLKEHASKREQPGHSIPQEYFTEMCKIWVSAYHKNEWQVDLPGLVYSDTAPRFQRVREQGRKIGILTSGTYEFARLFFEIPISEQQRLCDLVDEYLLGEDVGDKDHPKTFAGLWEKTEGGIYAILDDKLSVCRAAYDGLRQAGGSARLYLVDRKNKYTPDVSDELAEKGIIKISGFDQIAD